VNVRTLDHLDGTRTWINGGSAGHIEGTSLTGFGNDSGASGVVGARLVHEGGWRPNSDYDLGQGHLRIVHDLSRSATLDGGVELYGSQWKSPGYLSEDEFHARDYDIVSNPTDQGHKIRAQERASLRVLSGNKLWRSTIYATQGDWRIFLTIPPAGGQFEGVGSQTEEDDNRFGFGATSALTWQLSRGEVTLGAEGRSINRTIRTGHHEPRARFGAGAHPRTSVWRWVVRPGRPRCHRSVTSRSRRAI
jgi:hypothetical protein